MQPVHNRLTFLAGGLLSPPHWVLKHPALWLQPAAALSLYNCGLAQLDSCLALLVGASGWHFGPGITDGSKGIRLEGRSAHKEPVYIFLAGQLCCVLVIYRAACIHTHGHQTQGGNAMLEAQLSCYACLKNPIPSLFILY